MLQVSYVSQTKEPLSPPALLDLLLQCRRNNAAMGVTGMLLYGDRTFLQVIEGEDAVIDDLVATITRDPRHEEVKLLHRKPIDEREYGKWSMGFERVSADDLGDVEGLARFSVDDFTIDYLANNEPIVDMLLQRYREPHWDQVIGELDAKDRVIRKLETALRQVQDQAKVARLALEAVTEAARNGDDTTRLLRLCESTLEAMRKH